MKTENKLVAMIPARLGSKRIPKKNIRLLAGIPLLQYAIEKCLQSQCFDEIWVNSESELIGELAVQCGAQFYKRDAALATDQATNEDFVPDFLEKIDCERVFMVNSTSPLLQVETLIKFVQFTTESSFDSVFSVEQCFAECVYNNMPVNFSLEKKINSQEIIPVEKLIWAVTAWRRSTVLQLVKDGSCCIYGGKIGYFPIPKDQVCDLDSPEDWNIAEGHMAAKEQAGPASFWRDVR